MQRWIPLIAVFLVAQPALARDYDRNDVAEREISVGFGLSPMDIDTRAPIYCTDVPSKTCEPNMQRANVLVVRGAARRHLRHFYMAIEAELGATLPAGDFPAHPWLAGGGAVGLESANNAWDAWRGYAEIGVLAIWANTHLAETLAFTGEAGIRFQTSTADRPHTLLNLGLRGMYNFSYLGIMGFAGIGWTFD